MKSILKSVGWVLVNVAVQFVVVLAFSVFAVANGITDDGAMNLWIENNLLLSSIFSNLFFVLIVFLIAKAKHTNMRDEWKLKKIDLRLFLTSIGIAFAYSMAFSLFQYSDPTGMTASFHAGVDFYGKLGMPLMVLSLLVFAPLAEELMCRGVMIAALKKSFSAKTAVLLSSLIFGAMHLMAGGIKLAVGATLMGLVLGIIFIKTNSLWAAVDAHAVANLPDFILFSSPQIATSVRIVLAVVLLVTSVVGMYLWCKPAQK